MTGTDPHSAEPFAAPPGGGVPPAAPEAAVPEMPVPPASEQVINTASGKADGLDKCRRCGATEIVYSVPNRALTCSFCRFSWNEPNANETYGFAGDSSQLTGVVRGSGADKLTATAENTTTIKCQGCGAEVVVETNHTVGAKCHWCRQTLTINNQIPNGLIPDALVPFKVTHEEAAEKVRQFAKARRFFATKEFTSSFNPENLVGVYLPYVAADARADARLSGRGQIKTREYTVRVGTGDDARTETRYDADEYNIDATIGFTADDVFAESSQSRSDMSQSTATNNVINAVLPFNLDEAVVYSSHYLTGFTSERRDLDVEDVSPTIQEHLLSLARAGIAGSPELRKFDRGVKWTHEGVRVDGIRWQTLYLPVWLYAFPQQRKGADDLVHFIAVNGQTGKTMGSIPLNHAKAAGVSGLSAAIVFALALLFGSMAGE